MPLAEGAWVVNSIIGPTCLLCTLCLPPRPSLRTTKTTAAATPGEPSAGEVSFAAVLSAQLGLSSTAPLAALRSALRPLPEDKALPDTVPADAAADAANALSIVPLALPVAVQAPVATGEDIAHETRQER